MESIKMANDIVLETRGLVKKFGDAVILNGIDFTLHDKEVAVILGPSGCGKSTFLRCLIGLEPIQGGSILLKGKPLEFGSTLRSGIGMVFQSYDLFPHLTVLENILLAPLHVAKRYREDALAQAETLLKRVKLWDKRDFYPRQLSGGQKQRVGIARALASDPKILLCDEATSALDPQTTTSILELLKDINKRLKITIILITHEMAVVKDICDRVAVIEGGYIKECGSVVDIFTDPQSETMQEFVKSVINTEVPHGITRLGVTDQPEEGRNMLIRVRFKGQVTNDPLIANVIRHSDADISILYGNIDYIQNIPFGYLIFTIIGSLENQVKAFDYIKSLPVESEVLGYVPGNR